MVQKTSKAAAAATGDQQVIARILKEAVKSGKYTIGTKKVVSELKSAKMVIAANNVARAAEKAGLVKEAAKSSVPVVTVEKSSAELGRMLGRPFRVSAVSVRVVSEVDYRQLVGSPSKAAKVAE